MTTKGSGPYLVICYLDGYDTYVIRHDTLADARQEWEDQIANGANPVLAKELEITIEGEGDG